MKKKAKRVMSILLALILVLGLLPRLSLTAYADGSISYLDGDGEPQTCSNYTSVGDTTTTWNEGWYVVESNSNVTISGKITCNGDVNLILCDGASLTVTDSDTEDTGAIQWGENDGDFTIYAQSTGNNMGSLTAIHSSKTSGKGICVNNGNLTINGGNVTAQGGNNGIWVHNDITINNGIVDTIATKSSSQYGSLFSYAGNVTINAGTVTATGGKYGIQPAGDKCTMINGGYVTASGKTYAVLNNVKNDFAGTAWTDKEGTEGEAAIAKNTAATGQNLTSYKKVQFPAVEVYPLLWVGSVRVTKENAEDTDGTRGWSFTFATTGENAAPAVLTLNGVNITTGYTYMRDLCGIFYQGKDPLEIVLASGSQNKVGVDAPLGFGIVHNNTAASNTEENQNGIIISGRGSLTVKGDNIGIASNSVEAKEGEVNISAAYGIMLGTAGMTIGKNASLTVAGTESAIPGTVKNAIPGFGWDNAAGTGDGAAIPVNTDQGQDLSSYKKVQFQIAYPIWVGGEQVTNFSLSGEGWSYDPDTTTLTLDNANITGTHEGALIYAKGDLTIDAPEGMTLTSDSLMSAAVYVKDGGLTVNGNATIDLSTESETGVSYAGINAKSITVNGNVSVKGAGNGLYASDGDLTVDGNVTGTVVSHILYSKNLKVTGNVDLTSTGESYPICATGDVNINGNAAIQCPNGGVYGISGVNITVGGSLTMTGANIGLRAYGGKVTMVSGKWDIDAKKTAINAKTGIEYPETHRITLPNGGKTAEVTVDDKTFHTVTESDGKTVAARAIIEQNNPGVGGITTLYTLTYETNGGSEIAAGKYKKDATVDLTVAPAKEGFTFDGWYADADLTEKITSIKMDGDKTVYAGWKEADHDCPSAHLKDVDPNAWYHEFVDYVVEHGLMEGTAADQFSPNLATTRAMIVTILWRMEGSPSVGADAHIGPSFEDVIPGSWYEEAVNWAAENGIVAGYGNGKFGPDDKITREQFATILYRYEQYKGGGFTGTWLFNLEYEDADQISDWADEAMHWCVMKGIITGRTEATLVPQGNATRAEAAAILMRYIENVQ